MRMNCVILIVKTDLLTQIGYLLRKDEVKFGRREDDENRQGKSP